MTIDLVTRTLAALAPVDGTAGPDTLVGTAGDDIINGLGGNDVITGLAGDDVLNGGDGNDALNGGAGVDILTGGLGNDVYTIDNTADQVIERAGEGTETVRASASWAMSANLEVLILTGAAAINGFGNDQANTITGNQAANTLSGGEGDDVLNGMAGDDRLEGGGGADQMLGGLGADWMEGGKGDDYYLFDDRGDRAIEAAGGGVDTIRSPFSITLGDNIENLQLTEPGLIGVGNAGDNILTDISELLSGVQNGRSVLYGLGGRDYLSGGKGGDLLYGGDGDDAIYGGAGGDTMYGGAGKDQFQIDFSSFGGDFGQPGIETDTIRDFSTAEGDYLVLVSIDANTQLAGDQAFTLVSAFSKAAGQMTLTYNPGQDVTVLRLDVNGDGKYDYQMRLNGDVTHDSTGWYL